MKINYCVLYSVYVIEGRAMAKQKPEYEIGVSFRLQNGEARRFEKLLEDTNKRWVNQKRTGKTELVKALFKLPSAQPDYITAAEIEFFRGREVLNGNGDSGNGDSNPQPPAHPARSSSPTPGR